MDNKNPANHPHNNSQSLGGGENGTSSNVAANPPTTNNNILPPPTTSSTTTTPTQQAVQAPQPQLSSLVHQFLFDTVCKIITAGSPEGLKELPNLLNSFKTHGVTVIPITPDGSYGEEVSHTCLEEFHKAHQLKLERLVPEDVNTKPDPATPQAFWGSTQTPEFSPIPGHPHTDQELFVVAKTFQKLYGHCLGQATPDHWAMLMQKKPPLPHPHAISEVDYYDPITNTQLTTKAQGSFQPNELLKFVPSFHQFQLEILWALGDHGCYVCASEHDRDSGYIHYEIFEALTKSVDCSSLELFDFRVLGVQRTPRPAGKITQEKDEMSDVDDKGNWLYYNDSIDYYGKEAHTLYLEASQKLRGRFYTRLDRILEARYYGVIVAEIYYGLERKNTPEEQLWEEYCKTNHRPAPPKLTPFPGWWGDKHKATNLLHIAAYQHKTTAFEIILNGIQDMHGLVDVAVLGELTKSQCTARVLEMTNNLQQISHLFPSYLQDVFTTAALS